MRPGNIESVHLLWLMQIPICSITSVFLPGPANITQRISILLVQPLMAGMEVGLVEPLLSFSLPTIIQLMWNCPVSLPTVLPLELLDSNGHRIQVGQVA